METHFNHMQQELPRTPLPDQPGEAPPPQGPGPAPVPEQLPGEIPDPAHAPQETPPPIHARRATLAGEEGALPVNAADSSPAIERRLIGASAEMDAVRRLIVRVAPTDSAVLICGESGCGKDLVAESLHAGSPRADGPFVVINCGAIPATLIEAELFGCEKGGCTGATRTHAGAFERANDGTLLLDELTVMPLDMQSRLLRVLETKRVRRVGAGTEIPVDVRVLAATNRSPVEAVEAGHLRQDIYYRIAVVLIRLPPLHDRKGDIPVLADFFLSELNRQHRRGKRFSATMRDRLTQYEWPGNVRQLRNAIERAFVLCDEVLDVDHDFGAAPVRANGRDARHRPGDGLSLTLPIGSSLFDVERAFILATLDRYDGDKRRAAGVLGCSVKTLYNKLHLYRRALGHVAAAS